MTSARPRVSQTAAFVAVAVAVSGLLTLVLRVLVPTSTGGGDSGIYYELAVDPLDPITAYKNAIFQFRILVPFVVWLLPFATDTGFHVVTFAGLVAGATVMAALARTLGVGRLALAAAPLSLLGFYGFYGLLQFRMVDSVTVAVFAGAILAALCGAAVWCAVLSAVTTAAKEVGLLLPLAFYAAQARRLVDRPILVVSILVALPALAVFLALRLALPHGASYTAADVVGGWWEGLTVQGQWGYPRVLVQVLMQNLGLLWLLWPLGLMISSPRWRRLHLFLLALLPVLAGTHWSRSVVYLLPFVVPSALLVLARGRLDLAVGALAGSIWVSILLSLRNIGVELPSPLASNLALVPGVVVFALCSVSAVRNSVGNVQVGRFRARSLRPDVRT